MEYVFEVYVAGISGIAGYGGKALRVEGVQADVDGVQAGAAERGELLAEEEAVCGEGYVFNAVEGFERADKVADAFS